MERKGKRKYDLKQGGSERKRKRKYEGERVIRKN